MRRLVVVVIPRHFIQMGIVLIACAIILPSAVDGMIAVVGSRLFRSQIDVVIDPGHGGVDPGANDQDTVEKEITLAIALQMRDMLLRYGLSVGLTRDSDTDCSGWSQIRTGRHLADLRERARTMDLGRVAISIHVNTSSDPKQKGAMVFYASGSNQGLALAEDIIPQLASITDLNHPRPVPRTNLFVLTATDVPAVLVEVGFLSNPADKSRMKDEEFQSRLASAMARAVINHLASLAAPAKASPN